MHVGDMLRLQTEVAHRSPTARPPVQPAGAARSISSLSSSTSRSDGPPSPPQAGTPAEGAGGSSSGGSAARCTRCGRAVSIDGRSDTISFGAALHYCRPCTVFLERRAAG